MYDDTNVLLNEIAAGEDALLEFKEVIFRGDQPRFAGEEGKAQKVIAEVLVSMANTELPTATPEMPGASMGPCPSRSNR